MQSRSRRSVLATLAAGVGVGTAGCLGGGDSVSVLAAGSLAVVLDKHLGQRFKRETGIAVRGEYYGTNAVMRMVKDGRKYPDVVVSADARLLRDRLYGTHSAWDVSFASNAVGIAYAPDTRFGQRLNAGDRWYEVARAAADGDLAISDPDLDPLGYRAIHAFRLAEREHGLDGFADTVTDTAYREPEEPQLLAGVESPLREALSVADAEFGHQQVHRPVLRVDARRPLDVRGQSVRKLRARRDGHRVRFEAHVRPVGVHSHAVGAVVDDEVDACLPLVQRLPVRVLARRAELLDLVGVGQALAPGEGRGHRARVVVWDRRTGNLDRTGVAVQFAYRDRVVPEDVEDGSELAAAADEQVPADREEDETEQLREDHVPIPDAGGEKRSRWPSTAPSRTPGRRLDPTRGAFAPPLASVGMVDSSPSDAETLSLEAARRELGRLAAPVDRTDRIPLSVAVGRVLAADAAAATPVDSAAVAAGDTIFRAGRRIRPADVGLLKAAGVNELRVRQRPQVGVVPTGDELDDAAGGDRAETAGFTLAQYVDRWGGKVTYRNPVADDAPALRMAVQRDLTRDAIAVTGTEPGDTLREVVADLGDVLADRIAVTPVETAGLAVVEGRPVLLLPESPAGVRVGATQLLRPLVKTLAGAPLTSFPERRAELTRGIETDAARRSFVPVTVDGDEATPLAGTDLGTVTRADGWVSVPLESSGPAAGTTVAVQNWDALP